MSCFQILVVFVIAQCYGHSIHRLKAFSVEHNDKPYIQRKWTSFAEIHKKRVIQKRELESGIIPPTEEKLPAPVVEAIKEQVNVEAKPFLVPGLNRIPLTRSVEPLNTNIQKNLPPEVYTSQIQTNVVSQGISEIYGSLPPRPEPIPAEPIVAPVIVPPNNPTVPPPPVQTAEEVPPPVLFDRTRMRQYVVYAGDVILKYLSQFFNRARLTYNRFTSPPPPNPVFEN